MIQALRTHVTYIKYYNLLVKSVNKYYQ